MTGSLLLTNARIVTRDEIITGTLEVDNGRIVHVDRGNTSLPQARDVNGDYILPGFIELHTDNAEKHFTPRPGVNWPSMSAVIAHDVQVVGAGITTVFDALSLGDIVQDSDRLKKLDEIFAALERSKKNGVMRADHYLHMRCEVSFQGVLDLFKPFTVHPMVRLVSLMDHAPGQRQFADESKYREYYMGKFKFGTGEMDAFIARHKQISATYGAQHRAAIVDICKERGLPMASHDDATEDHVAEAVREGMVISEFPTTMVAAHAARRHGLAILMGAPNLVRGKSHSGNVSARELAAEGLLDIISSDYFPGSIMQAVFTLHHQGIALPKAVATATANPAMAAGLTDRGEIAPGKRADLVRVHETDDVPAARETYVAGCRVF